MPVPAEAVAVSTLVLLLPSCPPCPSCPLWPPLVLLLPVPPVEEVVVVVVPVVGSSLSPSPSGLHLSERIPNRFLVNSLTSSRTPGRWK